jgi:small GTP-binding protein
MDDKIRLKVIFVGSGGVGKTSLITQYLNKTFTEGYLMTVGVDKSIKNIKIEGKDVTLEINDTAGQEDYRQVNKIFMKNTKIAIIVYDITNRASFEEIPKWIETVNQSNQNNQNNQNNKIIFGLAANKSDLYEKQEIKKKEGSDFADKHNLLFFETSAKDYDSIENVFMDLTKKYLTENNNNNNNNYNNNNNNNINNINVNIEDDSMEPFAGVQNNVSQSQSILDPSKIKKKCCCCECIII